MKSKSFLMLLIGMISITVMGATPLSEQKPETTLVYSDEYSLEVEKVASNEMNYVIDINSEMSFNVHLLVNSERKTQDHSCMVNDVGFIFESHSYSKPFYQETITYFYLPDLRKELEKIGINNIRTNS